MAGLHRALPPLPFGQCPDFVGQVTNSQPRNLTFVWQVAPMSNVILRKHGRRSSQAEPVLVRQTQVLRPGSSRLRNACSNTLHHGRREEERRAATKAMARASAMLSSLLSSHVAVHSLHGRRLMLDASREGPIVRFAHDHFHVAGAPPGLMPSEGASWRQCPVCHRRSDRRPPTRRNMRAMAYSKSQRTGNQHPHGHRSRGRKRTR